MRRSLQSADEVRRCALQLLARREHGRLELARKLAQRGAPAQWIDGALEALQEKNLLSETRYLHSVIRTRSEAGFGPLHIRQQLQSQGIAADDIESALCADGIDWPCLLKHIWQKKFKGQKPKTPAERARQTRFLAQRGWPLEAIARLLRAVDD